MSAATLTLAALLSLLPACLGWLPGAGWSPEGASFAALAALPWIALAALPRHAARGGASPLVVASAALAPLALGAALDVRLGASPGAAAWVAGWAVLAAFGLAAAAEGGRRRPVAYGLVWLALVPVPAALLAAGAGGAATHAPLAWFAARVPDLVPPAASAVPFGAAACVAVLAAIGGRAPAREEPA